MNYGELKTAVLSDSHRENYTAHIARFISQAESYISQRLSAYPLLATLNDVSRGGDSSANVYDMPSGKMKRVRHLMYQDAPLIQVDETLVAQARASNVVQMYALRPRHIVISSIPPAGATFELHYFGLPAVLVSDSDTNTLLTDYPQLYIEATQQYVFKRARDFEAAQVAKDSADRTIRDLNTEVRALMASGQSANPYNVSFRSSY